MKDMQDECQETMAVYREQEREWQERRMRRDVFVIWAIVVFFVFAVPAGIHIFINSFGAAK